MIDQKTHAPRRYFVDGQGQRVLIGLSLAETAEFEALDLSPMATSAAPDGGGSSAGSLRAEDTRWIELYSKHEQAWRNWIAQSRAEQAQDLAFVNHA
jgi:hypothetical protein